MCLRLKHFRDKYEKIFTGILNALLLVLSLSIILWVMIISFYLGDDLFTLSDGATPFDPIHGWMIGLLVGGVLLILLIVCAGYAINNGEKAPSKGRVVAFLLLVCGAGTIPFNAWGQVMTSLEEIGPAEVDGLCGVIRGDAVNE